MRKSAGVRLFGGKIVQCTILKQWWFMRLVMWTRHDTDFDEHYTVSKWKPSWRVIEVEED